MNIDNKKVKIDVEKIIERGKISNKFKKFITENKDTVFTAVLDIKNNYTIMYELKEDDSNPKWLFWIEDLIVMEE